jgi:thiol-disulfide isomerase/thioredoxin
VLGLEPKGDMKLALDQIAGAKDADKETRSRASGIGILEAANDIQKGGVSSDEWVRLAEQHLKNFPESEFNKTIESQLSGLKVLAELKTKPLELKFTAMDGHEVDLSKMSGKVVLVDFWATWCGPCVAEVPHVVEAYKKLHSQGFEIVGISLDEDKAAVENFVKDKEMTWPQYFDGKGWQNEISSKFGIRSIPAMWLVDKKGMVVSTNARGNLEQLVEKYLAE